MTQHLNLEAAQAAFFASGGRIVVLEGFEYVPLPARKEPPKSKRRGVQKGTRQMSYAARVAEISKAAETMTCTEAAEHFGISASTLSSMAIREDFSFVVSSRRRKTPYIDPDADAALAAKIRRCMAYGMSRNKARTHLGISEGKLLRIIYEFSIDYPKKVPAGKEGS